MDSRSIDICRIARAIHRTGKSISQSIAIAVSRVKKWAAGADDVDADTRAKAAKAVAQWEALKAKNKVKKGAKKAAGAAKGKRGNDKVEASRTGYDFLCLARTDFNVDTVRRAFDLRSSEARKTWREQNPNSSYSDGPPYLYIKEMWTNYLIVQDEGGYRGEGTLFKVPYSVDKNQSVTFEEPVAVTTKYVAVSTDDMPGGDLSDSTVQTMVEASERADVDHLGSLLRLARPSGADLDTVLHFGRRLKG